MTATKEAAAAAVTRCAWCGEGLGPQARRLSGRTVCPGCGVATTDPWPSPRELDEAYAGWYRPQGGRFSGPLDLLLRRFRGRLASRLDEIAPPGPVLDVGAGDGTLLDALRRRGREAEGLERSSDREDVRPADIGDLSGEYAAVVFWHSLEHLPDPRDALAGAAGLLVPGGVMIVAIPNAGSLQARAFGDRWFALDLPRHLVHVPAAALLARLEALGLRVGRVSHTRGGQAVFGWLHGLVACLPGRPDLYDAIRRAEARRRPMGTAGRLATLAAGVALLPLAACAAALEVLAQRGGSIYVEAYR